MHSGQEVQRISTKMDVRNSSGAIVSILNSESRPGPRQQHRHSCLSTSHPPRFISSASASASASASFPSASASPTQSPSLSPQTPALDRSDTSDSRTTKSSSPTTPLLSFGSSLFVHSTTLPIHPERAFGLPAPSKFLYIASAPAAMDPFTQNPQNAINDLQQQFSMQSQPYFPKPNGIPMASYEQHAYPQAAAPKPPQKKNSYPCPVSKQYACNEFFTTSGHAARHAKKHTGKKDAICPECAKAFTRKDNMEQHRRTHTGVRASTKNASSTEEPRTKRLKVERQKKQQTPTIPTLATNTAIPIISNPPPAPLNVNHNNNTTNNNIPANISNNNMNVAPVAQMEMGLLDPRLMDSTMSFNPGDFSGILPTSFQQNLPSLPNVPRPSLHRSSYQESLQGRQLPTTSSLAQGQPSSVHSNSPEEPSPSHAPALDALALAASRQ